MSCLIFLTQKIILFVLFQFTQKRNFCDRIIVTLKKTRRKKRVNKRELFFCYKKYNKLISHWISFIFLSLSRWEGTWKVVPKNMFFAHIFLYSGSPQESVVSGRCSWYLFLRWSLIHIFFSIFAEEVYFLKKLKYTSRLLFLLRTSSSFLGVFFFLQKRRKNVHMTGLALQKKI